MAPTSPLDGSIRGKASTTRNVGRSKARPTTAPEPTLQAR